METGDWGHRLALARGLSFHHRRQAAGRQGGGTMVLDVRRQDDRSVPGIPILPCLLPSLPPSLPVSSSLALGPWLFITFTSRHPGDSGGGNRSCAVWRCNNRQLESVRRPVWKGVSPTVELHSPSSSDVWAACSEALLNRGYISRSSVRMPPLPPNTEAFAGKSIESPRSWAWARMRQLYMHVTINP